MLLGGLIGFVTGFTGGMILGQTVGAKKDREEAIKRIKQRGVNPDETRY